MIVASRRNLLIGSMAALFVAPAIVRAENIMKINPRLVRRGNILLTPQQVADEFARMLHEHGLRVSSNQTEAVAQKVVTVTSRVSKNDLASPEFLKPILEPMARVLASEAGPSLKAPPMPLGVNETAIGTYLGVQVRYVRDYDIRWDDFRARFDVFHN